MRRVATRSVLAAALALGLATGCAPGRPPARPSRAAGYWTRSRLLGARPLMPGRPAGGRSRQAPPALLAARVGALFASTADGNHFCTASVVASPDRDLLITAAHCINGGNGSGYRSNVVFIPGYRDGKAPFGIWEPARLLVAPQWANSADPNLDVGFVILRPLDGRNIEDVLGANRLGSDAGYRYLVRVTGYPASTDAPVTCRAPTSRQSGTQLRFDCGGFTGGTSGSPWVTRFDPLTRTGVIVGVIGGYQQGGTTDATSYSPRFGAAVQRLYRQAVAAEQSLATQPK